MKLGPRSNGAARRTWLHAEGSQGWKRYNALPSAPSSRRLIPLPTPLSQPPATYVSRALRSDSPIQFSAASCRIGKRLANAGEIRIIGRPRYCRGELINYTRRPPLFFPSLSLSLSLSTVFYRSNVRADIDSGGDIKIDRWLIFVVEPREKRWKREVD